MNLSRLKRLEDLEKSAHGGLGLVHVRIDGVDRQLPFFDVMDICFTPEYLRRHEVIILDVEEKGAGLLESIKRMTEEAFEIDEA